jgi:hypothetical protein
VSALHPAGITLKAVALHFPRAYMLLCCETW